VNLDRNTILETLVANREPIRSLGARRLGLFGSHARSEASPKSDLDFVVEFEPGAKSFDGYMDLKELLETLFDRPVDLVINEVIKPRLREKILAETIYASGL
jgi:predicted nucleotidyltransferase